jgi:hypothetical protein
MRILRPEQVRLLAAGRPATPANRSTSNESASSTSNNYADKRNAVQNGIGVSGDGNNTSYSSYSVTTDGGSVAAAMQAAVASVTAALGVGGAVANNAVNVNGAVANNAVNDMSTASQHLADVGLSMLQTNTALANSLTGGALQSAAQTTQIAADLAKTQVAAQNDNRYLIAAGIAVVAIVGVAAFTKGKA